MHFLKHESSKLPTSTSSWTPYLSPKKPFWFAPASLSKLISYSLPPHLLPQLTLDFCSFPGFIFSHSTLCAIYFKREGRGHTDKLQTISTYLIRKHCETLHNIKSGSIASFLPQTFITFWQRLIGGWHILSSVLEKNFSARIIPPYR